jgi:hypothetical protein
MCGTGMFLFLVPGTTLPVGMAALRLHFTFLRNEGTDLPVWSRTGSTTEERVQLSIPLAG